jgi:hypothetical protein
LIRQILTSPCTSNWLKAALALAPSRDFLDFQRDAEILVTALKGRSNMVMTAHGGQPINRPHPDCLKLADLLASAPNPGPELVTGRDGDKVNWL